MKKNASIQPLGAKGSFRPEIACSATWTVHIAGGIRFEKLPAAQPDAGRGAVLKVQLPNPKNAQGHDAMISVFADYNLHKLYIYKVAGRRPRSNSKLPLLWPRGKPAKDPDISAAHEIAFHSYTPFRGI